MSVFDHADQITKKQINNKTKKKQTNKNKHIPNCIQYCFYYSFVLYVNSVYSREQIKHKTPIQYQKHISTFPIGNFELLFVNDIRFKSIIIHKSSDNTHP